VATAPLTQTTGRRKEAVARANVRAGSGKVTVNGRAIEAYFTTPTQRMVAIEARWRRQWSSWCIAHGNRTFARRDGP
jgi:ribosomal protein S9